MENLVLFSGIYALLVNLLGFIMVGYDKKKSKTRGLRVPEKRFFFLACIGGAIGVYIGMKIFRHKTKHPQFFYGVPLLIIINLITFYFLVTSIYRVD